MSRSRAGPVSRPVSALVSSASASRAACARNATGDFAEISSGTGPPASTRLNGLRVLAGRRLFDDHVSVRTADTERTDPGPPDRARARQPRPGLGQEPDARVPVDVLRPGDRVQGPWHGFSAQRLDDLMTPATPAADCAWPMFDLSDPSHSGSPERSLPYTAIRACASIGSPRTVRTVPLDHRDVGRADDRRMPAPAG